MTKKLLQKVKKVSVKSLKRKTSKTLSKKGKASFGVLAVLVIVISLSAALGMGVLQLSRYNSPLAASYQCCDTGNGDMCKPIESTAITVRGRVYMRLKSGIKLAEGGSHLQPFTGNEVTGLPSGQHVYENTTETDSWKDKYNNGRCQLVHGGVEEEFMDTILRREKIDKSKKTCEAIPDDTLVYVCTQGCAANPGRGENGVFDAYIDKAIYDRLGVPDTIKNCTPPEEAEVVQGRQRIINLPSPSGKPNLQLETFYIEQDNYVANWVSPWCKPAIYLYPTFPTDVNVKVYPQGKMLVTIPEYPKNGWDIKALPNGDIYSGTDKFDYLFYEAAIPDELIKLPNEGYVVSYGSLNTFIPELVSKMGLNEKETRQFSEYWLAVLPKSPYYQIKVISNVTLGKISPLLINPYPKTTIRVTLHFKPLEEEIEITAPRFTTPKRDGFTVVEWGGIFKRDTKHNFSCFM